MKINIGAGDQKIEGFISVDYDSNCNPDYVVNIEKDPLPFPDNSVDQVIIHHVLEHLGEGYFHFLQELYRVCRHGAMIDILVPHPRHDYYLNDPTHRRPITVEGMWLFSKKYNEVCRQQNARASRLADYFGVDFEVVDSGEIPDPRYAKMFEGQPADSVRAYLPQHNNIIMETRIMMVAIKEYD
jgi:ubiquinone/menaquinone biosynthesis C-methylase UbiE